MYNMYDDLREIAAQTNSTET